METMGLIRGMSWDYRSNAMRLVARPVAAMSGMCLDIIDETASAWRADCRRRPLLSAARYTVAHRFYGQHMARQATEVVNPDADDSLLMDDVFFNNLYPEQVHDASRTRYRGIAERAGDANDVILGCTEISLLLNTASLPVPSYDSIDSHAEAAMRLVLAKTPAQGTA